MIDGDELHLGLPTVQHYTFRGILTNRALAMHLICCLVMDSCVIAGGLISNSKVFPTSQIKAIGRSDSVP